MDKNMYSEKFLKFIEMWEKDFGISRTIDEKVCLDRDNNPIPWYTYPAIEYISQFDFSNKTIFEFGCGYSSLFWAKRAKNVISIEDNPNWFEKWQKEFNEENLDIRWRDEGEIYENAVFEDEQKYDVIIIDGKRRFQCAQTAVEKLADGGMIILDDSDRVNTSDEYKKAINKYILVDVKERVLDYDELVGDLVSVNDEGIELQINLKGRIKKVSIPFNIIEKAHLTFKF